MSDAPEPLDSIIGSIVEGREVDWESARSRAADRERRLLDQLRLLARIGSFATDPERPSLVPGERWGTFQLLNRLGHGAYGEVWRARDLHLDREVALKLLPDGLEDSAESTASLVVHEGHLLSRVRHPNVVTVFGADRQNGCVGLWMEYLDGHTLAEQLATTGRFESSEAASVGVDLCRALAAIHDAGLIHRDVKAQNVIREHGGRTVLMDLGVGIDVRRPRVGEPPGGTPLYLAPELFDRAPASTSSDLYSLGVLLFHLLSGTYPVRGETLEHVARAHARGERLLLKDVRPDLPEGLADVVERALEADPGRRFTSAQEMELALAPFVSAASGPARGRRLATMAGIVGVIAILLWQYASTRAPVPSIETPARARDSVLVAAFENRTGEQWVDGAIERALAHELSQSPRLVVASTQRIDDALRLMGKPFQTKLERRIAHEVALRDGDIRIVLAGVAEKLGGTYVLNVQAIEPAEGVVPVSLREEADSPGSIVPAIRRLASRIRIALGEEPREVDHAMTRLQKVTTPSLQALKLYSEAYDAANRELWTESESLVRSALELAPDFPSALNWLGWCILRQGAPREEWLPHFTRAFELASSTSDRERYFIVGSYRSATGDRDAAIDAYQTLVRLYPDHAWGLNNLIIQLHQAGRREEISDLLVATLRARPDDLELTVRTAVEILAARGIGPAGPYIDRARSLAAGRNPGMAFHSLWLAFLPVHEHWLASRPNDGVQALESASAGAEIAGRASPDWRRYTAGWFRLSFGQTAAAASAFARISNPSMRAMGLGTVALARGDRAAVLHHLSDYSGGDGLVVLLLVRAGHAGTARRILKGMLPDGAGTADPAWDAIRAETDALASRSSESALGALRRVVEEVPVAWDTARYYYHTETLATLLLERGDPGTALKFLETASGYRDRVHKDPVHIGYWWMRVQARLAGLYRDLGRIDDAQRLESDLLRLLERADPDFVLLRELQARQSAVATR